MELIEFFTVVTFGICLINLFASVFLLVRTFNKLDDMEFQVRELQEKIYNREG